MSAVVATNQSRALSIWSIGSVIHLLARSSILLFKLSDFLDALRSVRLVRAVVSTIAMQVTNRNAAIVSKPTMDKNMISIRKALDRSDMTRIVAFCGCDRVCLAFDLDEQVSRQCVFRHWRLK